MIRSCADRRTAALFAGYLVKSLPNEIQSRARAKLFAVDAANQLEDLRVPPGIAVFDRMNGTVYTMGKDGRPAGRIRPAPPPLTNVMLPSYRQHGHRSVLALTAVAMAALLVLAVVATYVVYWRRRSNRITL